MSDQAEAPDASGLSSDTTYQLQELTEENLLLKKDKFLGEIESLESALFNVVNDDDGDAASAIAELSSAVKSSQEIYQCLEGALEAFREAQQMRRRFSAEELDTFKYFGFDVAGYKPLSPVTHGWANDVDGEEETETNVHDNYQIRPSPEAASERDPSAKIPPMSASPRGLSGSPASSIGVGGGPPPYHHNVPPNRVKELEKLKESAELEVIIRNEVDERIGGLLLHAEEELGQRAKVMVQARLQELDALVASRVSQAVSPSPSPPVSATRLHCVAVQTDESCDDLSELFGVEGQDLLERKINDLVDHRVGIKLQHERERLEGDRKAVEQRVAALEEAQRQVREDEEHLLERKREMEEEMKATKDTFDQRLADTTNAIADELLDITVKYEAALKAKAELEGKMQELEQECSSLRVALQETQSAYEQLQQRPPTVLAHPQQEEFRAAARELRSVISELEQGEESRRALMKTAEIRAHENRLHSLEKLQGMLDTLGVRYRDEADSLRGQLRSTKENYRMELAALGRKLEATISTGSRQTLELDRTCNALQDIIDYMDSNQKPLQYSVPPDSGSTSREEVLLDEAIARTLTAMEYPVHIDCHKIAAGEYQFDKRLCLKLSNSVVYVATSAGQCVERLSEYISRLYAPILGTPPKCSTPAAHPSPLPAYNMEGLPPLDDEASKEMFRLQQQQHDLWAQLHEGKGRHHPTHPPGRASLAATYAQIHSQQHHRVVSGSGSTEGRTVASPSPNIYHAPPPPPPPPPPPVADLRQAVSRLLCSASPSSSSSPSPSVPAGRLLHHLAGPSETLTHLRDGYGVPEEQLIAIASSVPPDHLLSVDEVVGMLSGESAGTVQPPPPPTPYDDAPHAPLREGTSISPYALPASPPAQPPQPQQAPSHGGFGQVLSLLHGGDRANRMSDRAARDFNAKIQERQAQMKRQALHDLRMAQENHLSSRASKSPPPTKRAGRKIPDPVTPPSTTRRTTSRTRLRSSPPAGRAMQYTVEDLQDNERVEHLKAQALSIQIREMRNKR